VKWPQKKIKIKEEAISEILVADTNSKSGAEASDVEDKMDEEIEEEEEEATAADDNNKKPWQNTNHRLQQVVDYQPGDRLKEGTQIFILLSVQQKD